MKKKVVLLLLIIGCSLFFVNKIFFNKGDTLVNKNSSCISCHVDMQGFSSAHSPDKISCASCHLGDNSSEVKEIAHKKMVLVPGNLSNASQTCAKCHAGIDLRVKNSMMNTVSGIISVDKYIFNENDNLDSLFSIHHLENKTLSESHLRNKCASCHIGNEKLHPEPISELSRGGGCTACHLNYDENSKKSHDKYLASGKKELPKFHPSLSLNITDNHCFGCHSRSGRISTNYEGWHETLLKPKEVVDFSKFRILQDKRVFEKKESDVHHTLGLSCIDCHDSYDAMGDGRKYAHQEQAVNVKCKDCHFSGEGKKVPFNQLNPDEKRIVLLKKMDTSLSFLYSKFSQKNVINVVSSKDKWVMVAKNSGKEFRLSKPSKNCEREAHKNLTCSSCHTSWAPQCISCHTSLDKEEEGFDLLEKDWVKGKWMEKGSDYLAEFPTLGVIEKDGKRTIKIFSPGMIMHLEKTNSTTNFHRLFAPVSAHTISAKGKKCIDCHTNPVALGYGRGKLAYSEKGVWSFKPKYELEKDKLPKDAWIPFLKENKNAKATRKNARTFTLKEQQKILRVGACLTCHKDESKVAKRILIDFDKALERMNKSCILTKF